MKETCHVGLIVTEYEESIDIMSRGKARSSGAHLDSLLRIRVPGRLGTLCLSTGSLSAHTPLGLSHQSLSLGLESTGHDIF